MKTLLALLAAGVVLILGMLLIGTVTAQLDPVARAEAVQKAAIRTAQREELAPLVLWVKRIGLGALAVGLLAGAVGALAGALIAWAGVAKARNGAALVYARQGLYPAVVTPPAGGNVLLSASSPAIGLSPAPNEPRSQIVAALVDGNLERIPAGAMRPILRPDPETALLPDVTAEPLVPLEAALTVDPHQPHWLLIGDTGSGKSSAIYNVLTAINRQERAETIICEVDGVNWNRLAAADTLAGYLGALEAVEVERQRRVALLRAADVAHIEQLAEPPPYLVLVLEEAETVYGNISRLGREPAARFVQLMRDFASLGRKQGVMLVVATQTGTSQVFDVPTRKNFGHRFIFRSEPVVGDAWGLPRSVGLPTLARGTAYDLMRGGLVRFPLIERPEHLRMSPLFRNNSQDAGAVREAVQEAVYRPEQGVWTVESGIPAVVPLEIPPTIASVAELTPAMRRRIWAAYRERGSIRGVEAALWPEVEHGGTKFYVVRDVLRSNPRYQESA